MSADYYIPSIDDYRINLNITYNLSRMLREAGYPPHDAMTGAPCSEAGGIARRTAERLKSDVEHFRQFEPKPDPVTGQQWGTVEWAIEFCDELAEACAANPTATIDTWL
jgi:hypothetical protein